VNIDDILFLASIWVIPVLLAITMHEAAHGWAASKLGDDTALRMGRVTFNPLAHIDLFGTIILPAILISAGGILFGWAKPVPVNFGRLGRPRRWLRRPARRSISGSQLSPHWPCICCHLWGRPSANGWVET
jgi:Zn-dependent protease